MKTYPEQWVYSLVCSYKQKDDEKPEEKIFKDFSPSVTVGDI
jgi:hypothetical protein